MKTIVSSVFITGVLLAAVGGIEARDSGAREPISSLPFVITNGGSFYVTTNLTGTNGIMVLASDVTIDLNGFVLTGVDSSGSGIVARSPVNLAGGITNISVRNGAVRGWSGHGIFALGVRNGRLDHLDVSSNAFSGITLDENSDISNCDARDNGSFGIVAGEKSTVRNCLARGNRDDGFQLGNGSHISSSVTVENHGSGMLLRANCGASDCAATLNTGTGILAALAGCQIRDNTCISNNPNASASGAGIFVYGDNCRVEGNTLSGNGFAGITQFDGITNTFLAKNKGQGIGTNSIVIPSGGVLEAGGNAEITPVSSVK